MTIIVIRAESQIDRLVPELKAALKRKVALKIRYGELKPPMTSGQRKRLHAMARDLAVFTGEPNFIERVLMPTDIWPKEEYAAGVTIHFDETRNAQRLFKTPGGVRPKSVSDLEKDECSLIIDLMFELGANMEGFVWSDPSQD